MEDVEKSVPTRFEAIVDQFPNRVAIKTLRHSLTFDDLNQLANRIARPIIDVLGIGNKPIGLLLDKGAPLIATFLAALKAGKIYIPCEPWFPKERINGMLVDAEADLIVTDSKNLSLANELSASQCQVLNIDDIASSVSSENLNLSLSPGTLAYVLYTSGSLGKPKGVVHNHRNILHHSMRGINSFHLCPDDRMTLLASLSTSQACSDTYYGLLSGAALYPWDIKDKGLSHLASWIHENRLTYYGSSPSVFGYFTADLSGDEDFSSVRLIRLGGEAVQRRHQELYKKHFPDTCVFVNSLSSTETRSLCLYFVDKDTRFDQERIPVGYAVSDTHVIVVNDEGDEIEINIVGEIAVKSRYLAVGYWRQPEETQAAFISDPKGSDIRFFRTGDLGWIESDGCLVRLDRKGDQVKIRGYRVEPSEIEKVLREHPRVKEAVVVSHPNAQDEPCLVAYVVPTQSDVASVSQLKGFIASKLPDYMTPSTIVPINQLPLTPSGKLDRQALPAPGLTSQNRMTLFVEPRKPIEEELARIWSEVLPVEQVGIYDNFFELGGHSLQAMQVSNRIQKTFDISFPLQQIFATPTLAECARYIDSISTKREPSNMVRNHSLSQDREEGLI
jgi:amino acid adenylation domain-containing protein